MAASDLASILRVPCDVIWNPTDLGSPSTYGGTYLGLSREKTLYPEPQLRTVWAEEMGTYTDVFYCGERVRLEMTLRYPDTDAITTIAFRSNSPGSSGAAFVFRPGGTTSNTRAGTSLFANAGILMLAARARVDHPFLILHRAIPAIASDAVLRWSLGQEWGLKVVFYASVDTNGRSYSHGRRGTVTL